MLSADTQHSNLSGDGDLSLDVHPDLGLSSNGHQVHPTNRRMDFQSGHRVHSVFTATNGSKADVSSVVAVEEKDNASVDARSEESSKSCSSDAVSGNTSPRSTIVDKARHSSNNLVEVVTDGTSGSISTNIANPSVVTQVAMPSPAKGSFTATRRDKLIPPPQRYTDSEHNHHHLTLHQKSSNPSDLKSPYHSDNAPATQQAPTTTSATLLNHPDSAVLDSIIPPTQEPTPGDIQANKDPPSTTNASLTPCSTTHPDTSLNTSTPTATPPLTIENQQRARLVLSYNTTQGHSGTPPPSLLETRLNGAALAPINPSKPSKPDIPSIKTGNGKVTAGAVSETDSEGSGPTVLSSIAHHQEPAVTNGGYSKERREAPGAPSVLPSSDTSPIDNAFIGSLKRKAPNGKGGNESSQHNADENGVVSADRRHHSRDDLPFGLRNKKMKPTDCLLFAATLLEEDGKQPAAATSGHHSFAQSPFSKTPDTRTLPSVVARSSSTTTTSRQGETAADGSTKPRDVDVLCGRGGLINKHPGNVVYRKVVDYNKPFYQSVHKKHRILVSQSIVQSILKLGGRFLIMGQKGKSWMEIGYKRAVQKTSQALRERTSSEEDGKEDEEYEDDGGYGEEEHDEMDDGEALTTGDEEGDA
jgi:hypothetical protein